MILNRTVSIPASEEEVWAWREAAVRERKSFSLWARERLNGSIGKLVKAEVRKSAPVEVSGKVGELANIKSGIVEEFEEPKVLKAVDIEEAKKVEKQSKEELKRIVEAGKAMEKRYGR